MKLRGGRCLLLLFVCGFCWSKSVKVTELKVPPAAVLGESVSLVCSYDLANEELYVVKWYKDELEFYRFEPKDDNQTVYFPQPGIDLDLSRSGSDSVYLRNVALETAGEYKCQVSTEAPTYSCVQAVKVMNVIVLPLEGPRISGGGGSYTFGDNVTLLCTSSKSKPAATLRWRVNEESVDDNNTIDHGVTLYKDNLEVTSKTLSLSVAKELLSNGKLAIKYEASLYGRLTMNSKDVTILDINGASLYIARCMLLVALSVLICFTWGLERTDHRSKTRFLLEGGLGELTLWKNYSKCFCSLLRAGKNFDILSMSVEKMLLTKSTSGLKGRFYVSFMVRLEIISSLVSW